MIPEAGTRPFLFIGSPVVETQAKYSHRSSFPSCDTWSTLDTQRTVPGEELELKISHFCNELKVPNPSSLFGESTILRNGPGERLSGLFL
jgi:hypothetical protein